MEPGRRIELERVMAGLAAGDVAMVAGLVAAFGGELRATLVALSGAAGVPRPPAGELDGLVYEAAAEIATVAGAWNPSGGALPWVWARQRLVQLLRRDHGPHVVLLPHIDAEAIQDAETAWTDPEPPVTLVLDAVADRCAQARLVRSALERAVAEGDRVAFLLHAQQMADGDPSPAVTVARELGRTPEAVRQSVCRSRRRLAALARADARYRVLLELPLLGPAAVEHGERAA